MKLGLNWSRFVKFQVAVPLVLASAAVWGVANANEANWHQWRGPEANGVAPKGDPPTEWSETKNIKWKIKVPGKGTSTPIVWNDIILLHTAIPVPKKDEPKKEEPEKKDAPETKPDAAAATNTLAAQQPEPPREEPPPRDRPRRPEGDRPDRERPGRGGPGRGGPGGRGGGFGNERPSGPVQSVVLCLNRANGETKWQKVVREELPHEGHHRDHGYASHSPITDGKHIISYFGSRGLYCLDMDGNIKWEKQLGKMRTRAGFGEGASPALHENTVIVTWDHEGDDFIAAYNKETGDELWRQERDEPTSWGTPLVVKHEGKLQVVTNGTNRVRSYDFTSGDLLWECEGLTTNSIPSPVAADGFVYATSGFRGYALLAIKLGAKGDLTDTESVAWKLTRDTPYVPSPLLYGNRLYMCKSNDPTITAVDIKTGKPLFMEPRLKDLRGVYASPVGAAGRVYIVGRNGTTAVIKDADTFELLATNKLDEPIDASPCVVGKELYLRGHNSLYCIAE